MSDFFIARQHAMHAECDIVIGNPSVSVRPMPVECLHQCTCNISSHFLHSVWRLTPAFLSPRRYNIPRGTLWVGLLNTWEWGNFAIIAFYPGNGTRQSRCYYETQTGSHRSLIDPCWFQWLWVTLKGETPLRVEAKSYSNSSAWMFSLVHIRAFTYVLSLAKGKDMHSFRAVNVALIVSFKLMLITKWCYA